MSFKILLSLFTWFSPNTPICACPSFDLLHRISLIRFTALGALYFSWWGMIFASWGPKISKLCNGVFSFSPFSVCLYPLPPPPHLSKASDNCCLVVIISPYLPFGFLDLEKPCAILGIIIFPPYSWINVINSRTWCFSPWSTCCCPLKLFIFSIWVLLQLFLLLLYVRSFFVITIIRPSFYLTLSAHFYSLLLSLLYSWSLISPSS